jgi:hypothetical protein
MAMSQTDSTFRSPFTPSPGGSTPAPVVDPSEGRKELWAFFWLSVANSVIIGVVGVVAWLLVHH